jgi:hypothetical protein
MERKSAVGGLSVAAVVAKNSGRRSKADPREDAFGTDLSVLG